MYSFNSVQLNSPPGIRWSVFDLLIIIIISSAPSFRSFWSKACCLGLICRLKTVWTEISANGGRRLSDVLDSSLPPSAETTDFCVWKFHWGLRNLCWWVMINHSVLLPQVWRHSAHFSLLPHPLDPSGKSMHDSASNVECDPAQTCSTCLTPSCVSNEPWT